MNEVAVRFEGITKRFPGVLALDNVSLDVPAGACHAFCGENGAGKSTLGKVLAGIHVPDAGRVVLNGRAVHLRTPRDARSAGVGMVHQELAFCPNLSVAENLCLGAIPARRGFVSRMSMERRAAEMLGELGIELDVRRVLGSLTIAQQQIVQIAAAVGGNARIIVFDEPTSSLSQAEADRLYALITRLKLHGVTCIYVSHRMAEVFGICDSVSVLRDGAHVATRPVAGLSESELVQMMIGRPMAQYYPRSAEHLTRDELLRVEGLGSPGKFGDVSFALHQQGRRCTEGLVGAGRSEVARAMFGLEPATRGRVVIRGRDVQIRRPSEAIRHGIGLVPEDRKREGIIPLASARHNVSLAILGRLSRLTWVRQRRERALVGEFFDRLRVRARSQDAAVVTLSGGNQQKIVLARWLAADSRVLILDEPTRGVDVGAKAEIHALIGELTTRGAAVLLISSELPEVLGLADRILVLRAGRLVGEMTRAEATQDGLLRLMAGSG